MNQFIILKNKRKCKRYRKIKLVFPNDWDLICVSAIPVGEAGLDLHFCFQQKLLCCRHPAGSKPMSTGHRHLDGFKSLSPTHVK